MIKIVSIALVTFFGISVAAANAEELTLRAEKDNTLYENPTGDVSNGAGEHFFVGINSQGLIRRSLLKFDVAGQIPPGSQILSVRLILNTNQSNGADPISLYRALQDWGEGTSDAPGSEGQGAPSTSGDATWIHTFFSTSFWNQVGGDFDPVPRATVLVDTDGDYEWGGDSLRDDIQGWLDNPSMNFGYLLRGEEITSGLSHRFRSRENSSLQPRLVIEFCPPREIASWSNYGVGWPGQLGIPGLTSSAAPVLGSRITLNVESSSGRLNPGALFAGYNPNQIPSQWGGELLLDPFFTTILFIDRGGLDIAYPVPNHESLCGVSIYVQVLQADRGASAGISFTPGLELRHGL